MEISIYYCSKGFRQLVTVTVLTTSMKMDQKRLNKIHVEIARTKRYIEPEDLLSRVSSFLSTYPASTNNRTILCSQGNCMGLEEYVEFITLDKNFKWPLHRDQILYHTYKVNERGSEIEMLESEGHENGDDVPSSNHWLLPSREFVGLWESLIYEEGLKDKILKYVETTLLFSSRNVNTHIISCNRIILLHGPPGTGKTSLCKAVAQKLAIRLGDVYRYTHLVEINSHSLFSKWFSESGKLVMKLFSKIKEILEHPKSLVCVLIDEVESIAYARSSVSGDEPKDALRVVNAVLTQLDQIRKHPNVLILTTSNLTSTIDLAFIDRADLKLYIGLPSPRAIYEIYASAIRELLRVQILHSGEIMTTDKLDIAETQDIDSNLSDQLANIAEQSIGLSGRSLRKIPFLAHSLLVDVNCPTVSEYLDSLRIALKHHLEDVRELDIKPSVNPHMPH